MIEWVDRLQSFESRVAGTHGAFRAADAIASELDRLGLPVERAPFVVQNPYQDGRALLTENLSTHVGPNGGPRLVVIAHLDARGASDPEQAKKRGWRWDRSQAPGADDDASGCAVLLELARVLPARSPSKRIDLVFTGAEEMAEMGPDGFMRNFGADRLADDYALAGVEVEGAIAVDMLLRPRPWGSALRVYSDGRLASAAIAQVILHASWTEAPSLLIDVRSDPSFTWSDHGSFWAYGIGAVLLIEDDFHHARYHTVDDRFRVEDPFYDPVQLEQAARILVAALERLAD